MVSQQQTEFRNEALQVSVETLPGSRVTFNMVVTPVAAEAAYRKAIKNISKEVSVPGFRKGKAPEKLITDQYAQYIDKEWRDLLLQTAFNDAIKLTGIQPLNSSSVEKPRMTKCSREEGAEIAISFERQPEAPKIDLATLKVQRVEPKAVTDNDVQQSIEELQRYHAKWETLEPRPIQNGDYISLTIDTLEPEQACICSDERFHIEKGQMVDWMYNLILGKEVGVPFEGTSELDPAQPVENFKPTLCRFTIQSLLDQKLPAVDDALAQQAGCKDVETLNINIRKSLEQRMKQQAQREMANELEETLFSRYPIEVPKSLLDYEIKSRLQSAREAEVAMGIPEAEIRAHQAENTQAIKAMAEKSVKLLYLLDPIMREAKITITKDDLVQELNRQRYMTAPVERIINGAMKPEEIRQRLLNQLFAQKTMNWLVEQATGQQA